MEAFGNREGGIPLLARWTTDFDCGYKTNWWYCIKDTPLDIAALKSKRRYEIKKGQKNFEVRKINPLEYANELYKVTVEALSEWDEKYRPTIAEDSFKAGLNNWKDCIMILEAFSKAGELCGYAYMTIYESNVDFNMLRAKPECENLAINAALVAGICEYFEDRLKDGTGFYICDGARNIFHETAFQDYLEKYFGFRKAYCKLNLFYRKPIGTVVNVLMPVRKLLYKIDNIAFISKINAILRMEEIGRNQVNPVE